MGVFPGWVDSGNRSEMGFGNEVMTGMTWKLAMDGMESNINSNEILIIFLVLTTFYAPMPLYPTSLRL